MHDKVVHLISMLKNSKLDRIFINIFGIIRRMIFKKQKKKTTFILQINTVLKPNKLYNNNKTV